MRLLHTLPLLAALTALPVQAADEQSLHFVETEQAIELTVPAGGVWLIIPREGFVRLAPVAGGASEHWTFDLINTSEGIEIFGGFDAASRYDGIQGVWTRELEDLRIEEAPAPRNVRFDTEGDWEVIQYEIVRDGEMTSYLRAEAIEGDVWIDVQIEVTGSGNAEARRETALGVLKGLGIRKDIL